MSMRQGLDLKRSQQQALQQARAEASNPEALLARLCDIEQDMESIEVQ